MTNLQEEISKSTLSADIPLSAQSFPESADNRIVDYAVLEQLKADISENFFPELLKVFLDQGIERVDKIELAIAENDFSTLESEIHDLKSESATFGAVKLGELTAYINSLCNQDKKDQAFAEAKAIKNCWLLVYKELQK